jgi:hypothetical protein
MTAGDLHSVARDLPPAEELSEADKHLLYGFLLRKTRARFLQAKVLRVVRSPLDLDTRIQALLKMSGPEHPFPKPRSVARTAPRRAGKRPAALVVDDRTEVIGLLKKCSLKREVSFLRTSERFDAVFLIPRHGVRLIILNETLPTDEEYARYFEICRAIMPGIRIICLGTPTRLLAAGTVFPGAALPGVAFPGVAFPGVAFPGVAVQGAVRFLPRPFNIDAVEQCVRELLGEPQR